MTCNKNNGNPTAGEGIFKATKENAISLLLRTRLIPSFPGASTPTAPLYDGSCQTWNDGCSTGKHGPIWARLNFGVSMHGKY